MKLNRLHEAVFTKTDKERIDAVMYQAMFDETIRLRQSSSAKEQERIRRFLTEAYRLLAERIPESANQDTSQEDIPP